MSFSRSRLASFTIKGDSQDDAVLCTANKTYAVRSVVLSNLVLVVTRAPETNDQDTVVIRDQVQEILEIAPCLPKLQKLGTLLRGMDYDEGQEDVEMDEDEDGPVRLANAALYQTHILHSRRPNEYHMKTLEQKFKRVMVNWLRVS